jgi:hypothetical protein
VLACLLFSLSFPKNFFEMQIAGDFCFAFSFLSLNSPSGSIVGDVSRSSSESSIKSPIPYCSIGQDYIVLSTSVNHCSASETLPEVIRMSSMKILSKLLEVAFSRYREAVCISKIDNQT